MIDHIGYAVADYPKSRAFYVAALAPLGYVVVMENEHGAGLGAHGKPDLWIAPGKKASGPVHLAFAAATRAEVRAFHAAALAAGGSDNGAPGLRPHYHENYYGAFVIDPDGHNVEAVCHAPEATAGA